MTVQEEVIQYITNTPHSTCVIASVFGMGCKSMKRFLIRMMKLKLVRLNKVGLWIAVSKGVKK